MGKNGEVLLRNDRKRLDGLEALPGQFKLSYDPEQPKTDGVPSLRSQIDYFLAQNK